MICPECGTRLPVGQKECHFCGYHISEPTLVQSNPTQITSGNLDVVPTVQNNDDSKKITALALFISMFAFITAFANFYYQSTGVSFSESTVNLTSNITTTINYPKSYTFFGIPLEGYVLAFLMAILAFVVATISWNLISNFSIDKIKIWFQTLFHK